MGWVGALIGGYVGSRLMGSLGTLLGAVIGLGISAAMKGSSPPPRRPGGRARGAQTSQSVFCASAAAMLAKMAKADGVVTQSEIAAVEAVFRRLKFSAAARRYAVEVFRKAKDDAHSIYEYANDFATVADLATRELLYELLWDLAAADGEVSEHEERILRFITANLGIAPYWCSFFSRKYAHLRAGASSSSESSRRAGRADAWRADSLDDAYSMLGVPSSASDEEVKKAYREKAKQYHPDRLRAQGLPDGMIQKANERMAAVNEAWSRIKSARGMK